MWPFSKTREACYCAFCKSPRRIYLKRHVGLTNVLMASTFALTTSFALFGSADPRGLMIFGAFLIGSDIFIYLRWRLTIVCRMCGFDPVVYKQSPEKAKQRVKEFFTEQVENPEFWLTKSPLLHIQKKIRENEKKALELQVLENRKKASRPLPPQKTL